LSSSLFQPTQFEIDKIKCTRNKDGIKQHVVKWRGYEETIMEHFYVTLPSESFVYYFTANTLADFRSRQATEFEPELGIGRLD